MLPLPGCMRTAEMARHGTAMVSWLAVYEKVVHGSFRSALPLAAVIFRTDGTW